MAPQKTRGREILISLFLISRKLAYLQIITVLVYGSSSPKSHEQNYLNCQQNPWKLLESGFLFRACNFTKTQLFLRYFLRFFFGSFRGLLSQNTFHACSNSKQIAHGLFKTTQIYVNKKINYEKLLISQPCFSVHYESKE